MQYQLRKYQKELVESIFASWKNGSRRVLAVLPTAGGKTVIFSVIARMFLEQGEGVLVVAHRKELILQAKEKLEQVSGLEAGLIKAGYPVHPDRDIQIASIQSISRRKRYPEVGLVIIDEAHHTPAHSYRVLLEKYPNAYILGMTATPLRIDGHGFQYIFDELVVGASVAELIEQGYLSKFKLFASKPINTGGVRKVAGDFNQSQLEEMAMAVVGDVYPAWEKHALGLQTIIFASGISHSHAITRSFRENNIAIAHIDGTTPDREREDIIERFAKRELKAISNVGVFTEGFDAPGIEAVQCVRPTCSPGLWRQMIGRGLRIFEGKEHCVIIDHSQNHFNHGLPDHEIEYSLQAISLEPGRWILECPNCSHCFKALSHEQKPYKKVLTQEGLLKPIYRATCPNCQEVFDWEQGEGNSAGNRILKKEQGVIEEVSLDCQDWAIAIIDEIHEKQQKTSKKKGWIFYQVLGHERVKEFNVGDWRYLGKLLGYKPGWGFYKWREVQEGN